MLIQIKIRGGNSQILVISESRVVWLRFFSCPMSLWFGLSPVSGYVKFVPFEIIEQSGSKLGYFSYA
jgi:hypothetical protein